MDKLIVAVFDSEKRAYEGVTALNELDDEGSLALYAYAVVARGRDGEAYLVEGADDGPLGAAVGLAVGGLLGALAGPVGLAAGAAGGSLLGSLGDLQQAGVDAEFVGDVAQELTVGKTAVVAHVAEGWVAPLDARLDKLCVAAIRHNRATVVHERLGREAASVRAEIDRLQAELAAAADDAKGFVVKNLDAASSKLDGLVRQATDEADTLTAEADAKVRALEAKASKAAGELRERFEKHLAEVREDYGQRIAKLKEAGELTKEAVLA